MSRPRAPHNILDQSTPVMNYIQNSSSGCKHATSFSTQTEALLCHTTMKLRQLKMHTVGYAKRRGNDDGEITTRQSHRNPMPKQSQLNQCSKQGRLTVMIVFSREGSRAERNARTCMLLKAKNKKYGETQRKSPTYVSYEQSQVVGQAFSFANTRRAKNGPCRIL